jgi:hypothetical protein
VQLLHHFKDIVITTADAQNTTKNQKPQVTTPEEEDNDEDYKIVGEKNNAPSEVDNVYNKIQEEEDTCIELQGTTNMINTQKTRPVYRTGCPKKSLDQQ